MISREWSTAFSRARAFDGYVQTGAYGFLRGVREATDGGRRCEETDDGTIPAFGACCDRTARKWIILCVFWVN